MARTDAVAQQRRTKEKPQQRTEQRRRISADKETSNRPTDKEGKTGGTNRDKNVPNRSRHPVEAAARRHELHNNDDLVFIGQAKHNVAVESTHGSNSGA